MDIMPVRAMYHQQGLLDRMNTPGQHVVVVYHDRCMDGLGAAWVVLDHMVRPGNVTLFPVSYPLAGAWDSSGLEGLMVRDKFVLIVDFCFPARILDAMLDAGATGVWVIDHHQTARAHLDDWFVLDRGQICAATRDQSCGYVFDTTYSGAMLTHYALAPALPPHTVDPVIEYIQDRDLWRWRLQDSRALNLLLRLRVDRAASITDKLLAISRFNDALSNEAGPDAADALREAAKAAYMAHEEVVSVFAEDFHWRTVQFPEGEAVGVPCPPVYASDVCDELLARNGGGIAFTWWDFPTGGSRLFSLRSSPDGPDVSVICARYGGGGHRNAAGFSQYTGNDPVLVVDHRVTE